MGEHRELLSDYRMATEFNSATRLLTNMVPSYSSTCRTNFIFYTPVYADRRQAAIGTATAIRYCGSVQSSKCWGLERSGTELDRNTPIDRFITGQPCNGSLY